MINELNRMPILAVKAHTRPFPKLWLNLATGVILPVGLFFYFRMWMFRLRLDNDMKETRVTCHHLEKIIRQNEQKNDEVYKMNHTNYDILETQKGLKLAGETTT